MGRVTTQENNWHIPPGGLLGRMKEPLPWAKTPTTGEFDC